jgi:hypothetical protein
MGADDHWKIIAAAPIAAVPEASDNLLIAHFPRKNVAELHELRWIALMPAWDRAIADAIEVKKLLELNQPIIEAKVGIDVIIPCRVLPERAQNRPRPL